MTNPSTIWAQLSVPFPAAGSIPFVASDSATIVTQVNYLWVNPLSYTLSLTCGIGDQTGTDTINAYYDVDAYYPYNAAISVVNGYPGAIAGHSVSSSRGTGTVPIASQAGDALGGFTGWGYGSSPGGNGYPSAGLATYVQLAGIGMYVSPEGASGGEIRLGTVQVGTGVYTEWVKLTETGQFGPASAAGSGPGGSSPSLGITGQGWNNVILTFGSVGGFGGATTGTVNAASGRVFVASGTSTFVLFNSLIGASSVVMFQVEGPGGSPSGIPIYITTVALASGTVTLTFSGASTAKFALSFVVFNQ